MEWFFAQLTKLIFFRVFSGINPLFSSSILGTVRYGRSTLRDLYSRSQSTYALRMIFVHVNPVACSCKGNGSLLSGGGLFTLKLALSVSLTLLTSSGRRLRRPRFCQGGRREDTVGSPGPMPADRGHKRTGPRGSARSSPDPRSC